MLTVEIQKSGEKKGAKHLVFPLNRSKKMAAEKKKKKTFRSFYI